MKVVEGTLVGTGLKVGIAVSRFNSLVTEALLHGALDALRRHGVADGDVDVARCPGTLELPAVLKRLAASGRYDAVIALGVVIQGSTAHAQYINAEVAKGLAQASLRYNLPVVYGVVTTENLEQAIERSGTKAGNRGAGAAMTAIEMANLLKTLPGAK